MRLRYLRYFLAVAEELSFTRAAARVHIEPSPLSRAIRELESELQIPLFRRGKGGPQLTRAGEVFRNEACRLLALMEDARLRARSAECGYHGYLRIGLTDHLAQRPLIRLLARCREEEPLTEVRVLEMTVSEMVRALNDARIDAGFTMHPEPGEGVHVEAVWRDRFAAVIPRKHPLLSFPRITLREAARYPLLLFHPESCSGGYDSVRRWFFNRTPSLEIAEYVSGHEAMVMLAAAGYGVGTGLESQIGFYKHPDVLVRSIADKAPTAATFMVISNEISSNELNHFVARVQQVGQEAAIH